MAQRTLVLLLLHALVSPSSPLTPMRPIDPRACSVLTTRGAARRGTNSPDPLLARIGSIACAILLAPNIVFGMPPDDGSGLFKNSLAIVERSFFPTGTTPSLEELEEVATRAALQALRDPYTELLPMDGSGSLPSSFRVAKEPQRALGMAVVKDSQSPTHLTVVGIDGGSIAEASGLRVGDRIIARGSSSLSHTPLPSLAESTALLLTSPTVTLQRDGLKDPLEVTLLKMSPIPRRSLTLAATVPSSLVGCDGDVAGGTLPKSMRGEPVAYLRLDSFGPRAADEILSALDSAAVGSDSEGYLLGLGGVVLDLRNNPGGRLEQAALVASLFLDEGTPVVRLLPKPQKEDAAATKSPLQKNEDGEEVLRALGGRIVAPGTPVVVMIDSESRSAAEVHRSK